MSNEEKKDPTPGHKTNQADQHEESENEDQDSEYDEDSDDDDSRNVSGKKRGNLNKAKRGGVLHGRDKKADNHDSSISQVKKTTIKPGPVQNDEHNKKRTKERTITEIIEKVSTWRKLYNGVMIPNKDTGEVQL